MSAISDAIDALTAKVTALETVEESAISLMHGLADQIRGAAGNVEAINALADKLDGDANKLAQAIQDNTV